MMAELFLLPMMLMAEDWNGLTAQQQAEVAVEAGKEYFIKHPNCQEVKVIVETDGLYIRFSAECIRVHL